MKRVALWSAFFVAFVAVVFLLYPGVAALIRLVNDGVSAGSGYYNPYTRFVPANYEPGISLALGFGLSGFLVAASFYRIAQRKP